MCLRSRFRGSIGLRGRCFLICLWLACTAGVGRAQEQFVPAVLPAAVSGTSGSTLIVPDLQAVPDGQSAATQVPELPGSVVSGPPVVQPPGFWIVNTHQSPQEFDHACPRFCAGVTRYDQCAGYRPSHLAELCQSLQPGVPICIAVHGSLVSWEDVCRESKCTWQWLQQGRPDLPLQVICFTWPSDRPISPLIAIDFGLLGQRASRNGFYLADLIRYLPPESPVSLIGHSHGTRVISSALHLMGGGAVEGINFPGAVGSGRRIRAVFTASAIDHDWLNPGERFGRALCSAECILNLRNELDPALHVYPLRRPLSSRALGNSGFTSKDRRKLGGWSVKVRDLDVSRMIGHGHFWPNYFRQPSLSRSISNYIFFPDQYSAPPMSVSAVSAGSAMSTGSIATVPNGSVVR